MGDKRPLKIGHLPILDHLILGVTEHRIRKGEKELRHSVLETVAMNAWDQIMDALMDDDLDGAFILVPAAMELFRRGTAHRLLMLAHRGGGAVIRNRAAGIRGMEDFSGKTILLPHKFSMHHVLVHQLLTSSGLCPGWVDEDGVDVILDTMMPCLMPEALAFDTEGCMAGFAVSEPYGCQAVRSGAGSLLCRTNSLWPGHPCCAFILHEQWMTDFPKAVEELVGELVRSACAVEEKDESVLEAGHHFLGVDRDQMADFLSAGLFGYSASGLMPQLTELESIQAYMVQRLGLMDRTLKLNDWVDLRFARNAGA